MPIPSQKVVLTISEIRRHLICLIVDDLCDNKVFPETPNITDIRRLVVTGEDPVLIEITSAAKINDVIKSLISVMLPSNVAHAPPEVLQL